MDLPLIPALSIADALDLVPSLTLDQYIHWVIFVLGIVTLVSILLVALSCRAMLTTFNIFTGRNLTENRFFRVFFKWHPYYWWVFWIVLAMHMIAGIQHAGIF